MAEICCIENSNDPLVVSSSSCDDESISSRGARRRRMEIRRFKFIAGGVSVTTTSNNNDDHHVEKRPRMEFSINQRDNTRALSKNTLDVEKCDISNQRVVGDMVCNNSSEDEGREIHDLPSSKEGVSSFFNESRLTPTESDVSKYGIASVCGRRREMEDAVAVHPSFFRSESCDVLEASHYFAVYDGHGCSHVAMKCKERLHKLVNEELVRVQEWKLALERSFNRMDQEAIACNQGAIGNCRCELQSPECDAVGSTAVVSIVTPENIIVANCGDSRAVLCRGGKPFPLSSDHKPDRPDELNRIQEAGGRVIYWDGPRVLGVLAMSRAIGDNYLKPYVSSEPEVTITDRTADDVCLILASDGLWDVVSNETACGVARMCLRGKVPPATLTPQVEAITGEGTMADKACSNASTLLTKLALARHSTDNVSVVVIDLRKDEIA